MIAAIDLLPSALGLRWGIAQAGCAERLGVAAKAIQPGWAIFGLPLDGAEREVALGFTEADQLREIRHMFFSQPFISVFAPEANEPIASALAAALYARLLEKHIALLGPPWFGGNDIAPAAPYGLGTAKTTIWRHSEGRITLANDWASHAGPIYVTLCIEPDPTAG